MSPRRLIGARTLVVVLVFVLLEVGLRHFTAYGKWVVTERDPYLGWRPIPSQTGWYYDLSVEERINSRGYRDREWRLPGEGAGPEPFRVALLGNSMTYGTGVPVEETFGRRLETILSETFARYGVEREVLTMNFAVQGYVFEQMARTYEQEVRPFRPDLLVVATVPHDVLPFAGGPGEQEFPYRRTVELTASYDFLFKRVIRPTKAALRPSWDVDPSELVAEEVEERVKSRPYSPENEPLWEAVRQRMDGVRATVEEDGGRLVVLALPQLSNLVRDSTFTHAEVWSAWAESLGDLDGVPRVLVVDPRPGFEEAMAELLPLLRELGFKKAVVPVEGTGHSIIDPSVPGREASLYLDQDVGHYDADGHEVLARTLAEELVRSGLLSAVVGERGARRGRR